MKLLQLCVAAAIAVGAIAGPHIAGAQALGEAATLGAGVSSAGSASGSALGNSISRTLGSEGRRRIASSSKTSNSGGVVNLRWSREQLKHSATTARTQTKGNAKTGSQKAKAGSRKAQPDFVIFGADPQNTDSEDASASQPKASRPSASQPKLSKDKGRSGDKGSSGQGGKNLIPASH